MLLGFPREIGLRRNICGNRQDFDNYVTQLNGKASCYTSLYSFERVHPSRPWKMDTDSCVIDRAWWDFDTPEGGSLSDVKECVRTLVNRLNGDVRLVFTGRGFHVHQIFQNPVFGTAVSRHIDRYQRMVAGDLPTLDGVGHPQKLTRIPDTYNPKRNKWSVNIPALDFAEDPHHYIIPETPNPDYSILDPFRGETSQYTTSFDVIKWIADNPLEESIESYTEFNGDIGTANQVPIPPCLEKAIQHENPKHHVRLALAQHLAENLRWFAHPSTLTHEQKNDIASEMVSFIGTLGWRDFNPHVTRSHIQSIINYENSPSCAWLQNRGLCGGPCWRDDGTRR